MSSYQKFNITSENILKGYHHFGSDTNKVMLTNVAPVATNAVLADVSAGDLGTANGYTALGTATSGDTLSTSSGTAKFVATGPVFTASGGSVGPFQYAILYQSTAANTVSGQPTKPLIAFWDYGSSITLLDGETFTVSFDGTAGIFTLA